jgi:hypothetical protein
MLVEKGWYKFTVGDAYGDEASKFPKGVPLVLDFAVRGGACPSAQGQRPPSYAIATASGHLMAMVMAATVPKGTKATLTYATDAKVQLN